jgi:hypothetical protein
MEQLVLRTATSPATGMHAPLCAFFNSRLIV